MGRDSAQHVMMECLMSAVRDLRRASFGVQGLRPRVFEIWRGVWWPYIHQKPVRLVRFDCLLVGESLLPLDDDQATAYMLMTITGGRPRRVLHVYRQLRAAQRWCEGHGS